MAKISFKAKVTEVEGLLIVRLPKRASDRLPTRSLVVVEGSINGAPFAAPLEPDGKKGHWLHVDKPMERTAKLSAGSEVELAFVPADDWPEPDLPDDFLECVNGSPAARETWQKTTVKARWEWLRWVRSTKNPATRQKRIAVSRSKLESGMRRPCCFDASSCTVAEVAKSGVLVGA